MLDDKTRSSLGVTLAGKLHHAPAIDLLVKAARVHPDGKTPGGFFNHWDGAEGAVREADPEVAHAALRGLLALHLFNLDDDEPSVAMRNVRVGDVVRLHGTPREVRDIHKTDHPESAITRLVQWGQGCADTFIYDRNVRIPLVYRPPPPPSTPSTPSKTEPTPRLTGWRDMNGMSRPTRTRDLVDGHEDDSHHATAICVVQQRGDRWLASFSPPGEDGGGDLRDGMIPNPAEPDKLYRTLEAAQAVADAAWESWRRKRVEVGAENGSVPDALLEALEGLLALTGDEAMEVQDAAFERARRAVARARA